MRSNDVCPLQNLVADVFSGRFEERFDDVAADRLLNGAVDWRVAVNVGEPFGAWELLTAREAS